MIDTARRLPVEKRELDRLGTVMAEFHSENVRLQRVAQDGENARDSAIADRDLAVADRDNFRAHLAQLASGVSFALASISASMYSKRSRATAYLVAQPSVLWLTEPPLL